MKSEVESIEDAVRSMEVDDGEKKKKKKKKKTVIWELIRHDFIGLSIKLLSNIY